MRAVRFYTKHDIRVEDVPPPSAPLGEHEVLVEPIFCGICGSDLHEYVAGPIITSNTAHPYTGAALPQILGHEFSARITDTGNAVKNVKPGDRVSIQPLVSPRDDYFGRRGLYHLSPMMGCIGLNWAWGGMGQQAVLNDYNVVRIPSGVSDVQAAVIEPAVVAVSGIDRAKIKTGSSILISGCGPIGALALLAAKAAGATTLIVSEPNAFRRAKALELVPETIVVDPIQQDLQTIIRDLTEEGIGVDAAIECAGAQASLTACIRAIRRQGTVVQLGLHTGLTSVDLLEWCIKDMSLEALWAYPVQSWPRIIAMVEAGIYPVEKIVTAQISPDHVVKQGFDALLDPAGEQMKILVQN